MKLSQKIKANADVGIATVLEVPAKEYLPDPAVEVAYILFAFDQDGSFSSTGAWPTIEECKQHIAKEGYIPAETIDSLFGRHTNVKTIPYQDLSAGPGYQKGQKVWVTFENRTKIAEIVAAVTPYQYEVKYEGGETGYVVPGVLSPYLEDTTKVKAVLDLAQIRKTWEAYKRYYKEESINREESRPFDFVGLMEFLASDHLEKYYKEDEA